MKKKWNTRNEKEQKNDAAGDYGEQLIHDYFNNKEWQVFSPNHTDGAHLTDLVLLQYSANTFTQLFAEVKTKPRLIYHNATGYNRSSHFFYKELSKQHQLFVFFVDYKEKKILFNEVNKLEEYTFNNQPEHLILFRVDKMKTLRALTEEEITTLKELENNNY